MTRKGAIRAREGDMGIIPGSMGAQSFVVRGKGNPESFHSCSHDAGRKFSSGKTPFAANGELHQPPLQSNTANMNPSTWRFF